MEVRERMVHGEKYIITVSGGFHLLHLLERGHGVYADTTHNTQHRENRREDSTNLSLSLSLSEEKPKPITHLDLLFSSAISERDPFSFLQPFFHASVSLQRAKRVRIDR